MQRKEHFFFNVKTRFLHFYVKTSKMRDLENCTSGHQNSIQKHISIQVNTQSMGKLMSETTFVSVFSSSGKWFHIFDHFVEHFEPYFSSCSKCNAATAAGSFQTALRHAKTLVTLFLLWTNENQILSTFQIKTKDSPVLGM